MMEKRREILLGSLTVVITIGAILLAAELTPMLAEGARGNPRQIKRFVNTMALRLSIAEERGFRGDLKEPVLAKLMLAERFAPEVFDAIAQDLDAEGKSKIVGELEGTTSFATATSTGNDFPVGTIGCVNP